MCLNIAIQRPNDVLATGEHCGFKWQVIHNCSGFRCGYVRLPPGHPWHGLDYDSIGADVHGGLTFAVEDTPCDKGGSDDGWWIGFDCAHLGDSPDPELKKKKGVNAWSLAWDDGVVRSQEYVEAECRSLCEQAKHANANPTRTN